MDARESPAGTPPRQPPTRSVEGNSSPPEFIPHEALKTNALLPYAGECFDEPEEGDSIVIEGHAYEFSAELFQDERGQWWERFGWFYYGPVYSQTDEEEVRRG